MTRTRKTPSLHNLVHSLGDYVARQAEEDQPRGETPEPGQGLVFLARNKDVHAPQTGDDIHGQDDGTEDGQLAEDIGRLLGALVHADIDLSKVVSVRPS